MLINRNIKKRIFTYLQNLLNEKQLTIAQAIESTKEARNSDTKSSAGDKFETGRAMMQIEIEKNEVQLNKTMNLQKELSKINISKDFNKVEYGSLVITNDGTYFIAIGIGKIELDNNVYYSISLASPMGQLLNNLHVGDKRQFQGRELFIKDII